MNLIMLIMKMVLINKAYINEIDIRDDREMINEMIVMR